MLRLGLNPLCTNLAMSSLTLMPLMLVTFRKIPSMLRDSDR